MERKKSKPVRQFILEQVEKHPHDIVHLTEERFSISRQAVNRYIQKLISEGLMLAEGSTRRKTYKIKPITEKQFSILIWEGLQEDVLWRRDIRPLLDDINKNVLDICNYGFTEIVNNVIDHSSATLMIIEVIITAINIRISVFDNGIGIFKKIQAALGLEDRRHAILELTKGKLTTDPEHHTGEGIFFSSRAFDKFSIYSGGIGFHHIETGHDWLMGEEENGVEGTIVKMEININSPQTLKEVFDKYTSDDDEYGFNRTIVPVSLAKYGDENLISRSQAKRLLSRFEKFTEVVLDFKGVETIGQAFADEIYRVFALKNPHIHLMHMNANEEVKKSIKRAFPSSGANGPFPEK